MPLQRIQIPVGNFRSRGGADVRLIVFHTAEGATNFQDLGHFFQTQSPDSSHVGIDDGELGVIGEYVQPANTAFSCIAFNDVSVNAETCAFADWTEDQWRSHDNLLRNLAQWAKEESDRFGIPLVALTPGQAQSGGRGVCRHSDLGVAGGDHHDPGPGFPMDFVLNLAQGNPLVIPPQTEDDEMMTYLEFDDGGSAAIAIPNQYSDGTYRARLFCNRTCTVQLDLRTNAANLTLGYDAGPQGLLVPAGVISGVVRMVTPPTQNAKIAITFSH
jgi:hypothetical protein